MRSQLTLSLVTAAAVALVAGCHHAPPPAAAATPTAATQAPASSGPAATTMRPAPPPPAAPGPDAAARRAALVASLATLIHFDYNVAELRPDDRSILDMKAKILRANPGVHIRITGNCDERGSDQYNIALGIRRAAAAKEYLALAGIDGSRIDVSSLGREKPLDPASNDAAWTKNRRDEFEITAGGQALVSP